MSDKARKFPIEIDLQAHTPAYIQIVLQIQGLILRRGLLPGEQLPTVRSLAAALSINFNTVARAYRLLDRAGLITTQQGRGTFVVQSVKMSDDLPGQRRLREQTLRAITKQYLDEVRQLDFKPAEVKDAFTSRLKHWIDNDKLYSSEKNE
jgi:GntR family transcriptional regulator